MLRLNFIRENKDLVIKGLKVRNFPEDKLGIVDEVIQLDVERKQKQKELDDMRSQLNAFAKEIGDHFKKGEKDAAELLKNKVADLKAQNSGLEEHANAIDAQLPEDCRPELSLCTAADEGHQKWCA